MDVLVVGAGVVGSATGRGLSKLGHRVRFVDTSPGVVVSLAREGFDACLPTEYSKQNFAPRVAILSVPTPEMPDGQVNLSYIDKAAQFCANNVVGTNADDHVTIVVRSTVPPGTTRSRILPRIVETVGSDPGSTYSICFHPEFLRAVSAEEDFMNPWAIVAGVEDNRSREAIMKLYEKIECGVMFTDIETAEMIKYASNCFNATKISFSNEIWNLAAKLGLNGNRVLAIARNTAEGYWNQTYGTLGGRPYGGTCLPKDTSGLLSFAQRLGVDMPLLSAVIEVNDRMEAMADDGEVAQATIAGPYREPSPALAEPAK